MNTGQRQVEVAKAMNIEIKEISIQDKLRMRKEWVERHPGVKFVTIEQVKEPVSGAGRYYKDIIDVNLCSYKGNDGIIITERNGRVRIILFNGFSGLVKPNNTKASFKKNKDNSNYGRIRFTTIEGSSISCERVIGTAYGWMLDALPEYIEYYEVNVMNWSGSLKRDRYIKVSNFNIDNLEFCTGTLNKKHSGYCNRYNDILRGDGISVYEMEEMEKQALIARQARRREEGIIS